MYYSIDQEVTDAAAYALADASCSLTRWQTQFCCVKWRHGRYISWKFDAIRKSD